SFVHVQPPSSVAASSEHHVDTRGDESHDVTSPVKPKLSRRLSSFNLSFQQRCCVVYAPLVPEAPGISWNSLYALVFPIPRWVLLEFHTDNNNTADNSGAGVFSGTRSTVLGLRIFRKSCFHSLSPKLKRPRITLHSHLSSL